MPAFTRRGLLAGTAATAMTAAGTPLAALPNGADGQLVALAQKFAEGLDTLHAAERRRNDCEGRYFARQPAKPAELTRAGPLGRLLTRRWDWWDVDDLAELLANRRRSRHWPAATALLPIAEAHRAALKRCQDACSFTAAETAQTAALDAIDDLIDQILAAPAETLAGLAVKARVVKVWGRPEWWADDPDDSDPIDRLVAEVLDAVIGMERGRSPSRLQLRC